MGIGQRPFGTTREGRQALLFTLENSKGMRAEILNYGGTLVSLEVPGRSGGTVDVVLGYEALADYENGDKYLGALIGRYCNRIGGARLTLNGREYPLFANDGTNHLHGGKRGFDKRIWDAETGEDGLALHLVSPDGEEGYPGRLEVWVTYRLSEDNELIVEYRAASDADTVCSLTNHTYFNLAGQDSGDVLNQNIQIFADWYTPTDECSIPTGELASVQGTPLDLREPVKIGAHIEDPFEQLQFAGGYDHNFAVRDWDGALRPMARAFAEETGITLDAYTTLPGVQFYSGNYLDGIIHGKGRSTNGRRWGFCLESQFYPDSPAHPEFPSPVLRKGREYRQTTVYRFGVH